MIHLTCSILHEGKEGGGSLWSVMERDGEAHRKGGSDVDVVCYYG